jgi:hypothetical protein
MEAFNIPSRDWVMQDNKKYSVTVSELQAALDAGRIGVATIFDNYDPEA